MKTMKHILIISAFALAFLTGCVSQESYSPEEKNQEIRFSSPVVEGMTKAPYPGEISGAYPTEENFTVFAVRHATTFQGWTTNATMYMNRVECAFDDGYDNPTAGSGGWSSAKVEGGRVYYWPKEGVLTFAGYSPSSAHSDSPSGTGDGKGTINYGAAGLTITNYSVNANVAAQTDLMFCERTYDRESSYSDTCSTKYDGVDMTFRHTLSSIKFNIKKKEAYPDYTMTLKNISVNGVEFRGSFAENIPDTTETSTNYSSFPAWVPAEGLTNYTVYDDPEPTGGIELTSYTDYQQLSQGAILLPQIFKVGSTVENPSAAISIVYTVTTGSITVTQTASIPLSDLTYKWEIGKRYTYNIIIEYDRISVGPTVEGWTEVTVGATIK
jgi:hypothetical protein